MPVYRAENDRKKILCAVVADNYELAEAYFQGKLDETPYQIITITEKDLDGPIRIIKLYE